MLGVYESKNSIALQNLISNGPASKGDLPPPFFLGAAACHGGVGGGIGPIASKEGRFYNRPGVVTQKAERGSPTKQ